jgi:hypothetical protein
MFFHPVTRCSKYRPAGGIGTKIGKKSGPIMFYHTITTYTTTLIQGMVDCGVVVGRNKVGRLRYEELPK